MKFYFVYITTGSIDEAREIGSTLVKERLAACVNILPGMESMYHWNNEIASDNEVILIAKTSDKLFDELRKRVLELHTYECPCIVAIPVADGFQGYFDWLASNLKGQK